MTRWILEPAVTPAAVSSYGVALTAHILAVVVAYGAPLAYPMFVAYVRRHHPAALAGVHAAQYWLDTRVAPPASMAIVGAGAFMAFQNDLWAEAWLVGGILLFGVISIVGLVVIVPSTRQLAELAGTDASATSAEYFAVYRTYMRVEIALGVLVILAVFLMAAKPG